MTADSRPDTVTLAMLRQAKETTGDEEVRGRLARLEKLLLTPGTSLVAYFKNLQEEALLG